VFTAVADTNIYVSAFNFKGTPAQVLKLAQEGRFRIVISDEILKEISRVLEEKFFWHPVRLAQVRPTILAFAELVKPQEQIDAVAADPDDNAILECAVQAGAEYIISGDSHLRNMKTFRLIRILSAREFIEVLAQESA
jgi:putative PIN family toxin of toxin-antitoxin system